MIGLSVGTCIKLMLQGVDRSDVIKIISGTKCVTPEDWELVIERYRKTVWKEFPDDAEALLRQMLREGRIEQPRLAGNRTASLNDGFWVDDESQIVWVEK